MERCGECGGVIDPEMQECRNCGKRFDKPKKGLALGAVTMIVLAVALLYIIVGLPKTTADLPSGEMDSTPKNGQIINPPRKGLTVPLHVWTEEKDDLYITLVSRETGEMEMSFYVCGGEQAQVSVPMGEYDVYYASGTKWENKDALFGPNTKYYSVKEIYAFEITDDFQRVAQNLDLRPSSADCADVEEISATRFPRI